MKPKLILLLILVAVVATGGGWLLGRLSHAPPSTAKADGERKAAFYQSPMHPWIKSDKPGRCTICGMELVPVYEGDKGFDVTPGVTTLNSNSVTVVGVQTTEVRRQPLARSLRVAGTIDDDDTRHRLLSAYVDGRIEKLFINYTGAEVTAGQPLAVFYSPTLFAAEREYLSLLKQAEAAGGSAVDLTRLIELAAFRLKRLGLTDGQIAALPRKAEADYRTEILAPMTGTVVSRDVFEGKYVKEGDKLFEIADFATMWFKFDLYERDFSWVKPGQWVEISTPALAGQVITGAVAFVDPNLSEMTRSAKVRVEVPNPLVDDGATKRRLLRHRLYAEAQVNVQLPEVTAVPRGAVLSPGGEPIVYVDKGGGAYEQRRVRLGRAGDTHWEILEGLAEGERVVLNGNLLIDAQAQLNSSVTGAAHDHGHTSTTPSPSGSAATLAGPERAAALEYLKFVANISDALAADDLAKFNELAGGSHPAMAKLAAASAQEAFKRTIGPVQTAGHLGRAADLAAARKAFHPLSTAAVGLARVARGPDAPLKIYECPMTKDIFPGAPAKAQWLQWDAIKRNPYMGKRMLDCGVEIN